MHDLNRASNGTVNGHSQANRICDRSQQPKAQRVAIIDSVKLHACIDVLNHICPLIDAFKDPETGKIDYFKMAASANEYSSFVRHAQHTQHSALGRFGWFLERPGTVWMVFGAPWDGLDGFWSALGRVGWFLKRPEMVRAVSDVANHLFLMMLDKKKPAGSCPTPTIGGSPSHTSPADHKPFVSWPLGLLAHGPQISYCIPSRWHPPAGNIAFILHAIKNKRLA
eukprot:scaffold8295_cov17-Tisochrysis_lutea.AAC.1